MPRRTELTRNIPIKPEVIKEKMKKMKLTYEETAKMIHITPQRLKDCLAARQSHRFSEDEIIEISIKLALRMTELLEVPSDISRMKELKRIAVSDLKMMKYYTKWHRQEPPKSEDCSKLKSAVEIVKKDRTKYNPLKTENLPVKPEDPNKTYRLNEFGMKILCEEVRNGIKIVYQTL